MSTRAEEVILKGKVVKCVRKMTEKELRAEGWTTQIPSVIEFTDGTIIYPSRDPEGNGAGALFGVINGELIIV